MRGGYLLAFILRQAAYKESFGTLVGRFLDSFGEWTFTFMAGWEAGEFNYVNAIWYFSALLLSILLLYPLMLRFGRGFALVAAPLIVLFGYGRLCVLYKCMPVNDVWNGLCKEGVVRAAAGVSMGVLVYAAAERMQKIRLTAKGRCLVAGIEVAVFAYWCVNVTLYYTDMHDMLNTVALAVLVFCAVSFDMPWRRVLDNKFVSFLSRYSVTLFVTHGAILFVTGIWPDDWGRKWVMWLLLANGAALTWHATAFFVKRALGAIGRKLRRSLIAA